jgi:ABC-2 type transport system ATP-binding protein
VPFAVVFDNVSKRYATGPFGRGGVEALRGVSLRVPRGAVVGLLGPNRAGKTTLVKLLLSLSRPTSGTITRLDRPASDTRTLAKVGYVHENQHFPRYLTADELLRFYGSLALVSSESLSKQVDRLLDLVGLADRRHEPIARFSKGMVQRLGLAQALLNEPELLILDEPTEGLDPQSRAALWEELERISASGTTMLLTTHYMEEADRLASRLAIIDNGQIVVEGAPAELKREVGSDTVLLQLESPDGDGQLTEVRRLLAGIVDADAVTRHPAGVALAVPNAGSAIPELLRRLDGNGLRITGLQMSEPSLDDVFMKYTGRRIREESADQPIILGLG